MLLVLTVPLFTVGVVVADTSILPTSSQVSTVTPKPSPAPYTEQISPSLSVLHGSQGSWVMFLHA